MSTFRPGQPSTGSWCVEATVLAAAVALPGGDSRGIDVSELQRRLELQGAVIGRQLKPAQPEI